MGQRFEVLGEAAARIPPISQPVVQADRSNGSSAMRAAGGAADNEISRLIQQLFLPSPAGEHNRLVVFGGIDRGAGCSWVCARAAEMLAMQISGRVCLIDANLQSPSLHTYFQAEVSPGFADAISQPQPVEQFLRSTWTNHLWLMTSGAAGPETIGKLRPERVQKRFAELREEFDYLLVDVPAITATGDGILLSQFSDGIVLVIASNSTRRESARMAKQSLEDSKVPILGAVLNKRTYPIPEAVYRRL
ncbi:MAG: CpsD/CapB family tyrosine-protein kinase [Candidatus Acidiferrales bacterium]